MQGKIARRPIIAGFGAALAGPVAAQAEWRPDRQVRMIVPSGAGSGGDVVARALAAKLTESLGQSVVVENMPQGAGAVAILTAARARKDGQTLLVAISAILLAPLVDPALTYDAVRDFAPVSQIHQAATVLTVANAVPARTLEQFVAVARAEPARYTLATYGHGTAAHVHAALLNRRAALGVEIVHYPNTNPVVQDMVAGHIRAGFIDSGTGVGPFRDGIVRPLAVSGPRRLSVLPDVPCFAELGYAGFEPAIWQAVLLPAGTPEPVVATYATAVRAAIGAPDLAGRLRGLGFDPVGGTPDALAAMLASERATWAAVIAETGIRPG